MNRSEQNLNKTKLKKLKILFLTPRFPYPLIGGDRIKPFNILTHLAKHHEVTLVTFYQGGKEPPKEHLEKVKELGINIHVIPLNPFISGLKTALRICKYPLEISYYTQPKYSKVVNKLLTEQKFDLGIAFFMRTAEYIKDAPLKRFLMAEDCRTLYQKRSYQNSKNLKHKLVRYWEVSRLKKYEPKIVDKFDVTTLVTDEDIQEMTKQNPNAKYRFLTNGTDLNHFYPPEDSFKREGILFTGKLDLWANILMIQDIEKNIFPKVREAVTDCKFNIVGAKPPNIVRALQSDIINVFPNVPSLLPYYQQAKVFLHPHTAGTGIQNKLLEAMACGCPVVTTPIGIQGIPATHGEDVLIGSTTDELIKHTIELFNNPELYNKISKNCRSLIERTHSWEIVFESLDNILIELFETR